MSMEWIFFLFFIIALFHSMAGFGGGASYIAVMVIFSVPFYLVPVIALLCNIIVVIIYNLNHFKTRSFPPGSALPLMAASIPMAYLGGRILVNKTIVFWMLAVTLLWAGFRILLFKINEEFPVQKRAGWRMWLGGMSIGSIVGGISGMIGIGGGIFLSTLLHIKRWGHPKEIANIASVFILVNSIAGLGGHFQKIENLSELQNYWILGLAVTIGGLMGSYISFGSFSQISVKRITAVVILVAAIRICFNLV